MIDDMMELEFSNRRQASSDNGIDGGDSDTTLVLKSICIPGDHRANIYLTREDMIFVRQMVWLRSNLFELADLRYEFDENVEKNWNYALEIIDRGPAESYFKSKSRDVMKQGYCILEDMADPCRNVPQEILDNVVPHPVAKGGAPGRRLWWQRLKDRDSTRRRTVNTDVEMGARS